MDNKVIDLSDQFSISFLSDEEIDGKYKDEVEMEKTRSKELMSLITNFLTKLKSNPEATTIKWPNRIEDVEKFEQKLQEIYKG